MNARIKKLRARSLRAVPALSSERGRLLTRYYRSGAADGLSVPRQRAGAFAFLLANKKIVILPDELIVGERGPAAKATPSYPEITCHSLRDLDVLDRREKTRFRVSAAVRRDFAAEIIPYLARQDHARETVRPHGARMAGRLRGGRVHRVHGAARPRPHRLRRKDLRQGPARPAGRGARQPGGPGFLHDPQALARQEELQAMETAAEAMIVFAGRHAAKARQMAAREKNAARKRELLRIAAVCERVPAHAPRDFHEALQHYWFIHLGVISEANPWDAFNPGRLDQHLLPFYRRGLADGTLTREGARELLQAFWVKFNNHPSPPKVGVTAEESGTYTDFALINTGGVDPEGEDGVNEVSFLILDVIEEMRLLQPSSMVQVSRKNPDAFLHRALKIVRTGFGQPSLFNSEALVAEMLRQGKSLADARRGGASGCVETGAFGREAYILTGYFNLVKVLEITLNNGRDPLSGKQIGLETGDPAQFPASPPCWPPSRSSCAISSTSRCAAATSSTGSTPATCRSPSSRCSSTTASPRAGTTTTAAPATTPPTSRAWAWARSPTP